MSGEKDRMLTLKVSNLLSTYYVSSAVLLYKKNIYLFSNRLYMGQSNMLIVILMTIRKIHYGLLRLQQNPEQNKLEQ